MEKFELKKFESDTILARAAATDWLGVVNNAKAGQWTAFSGGRIAKTFYSAVAELIGTEIDTLKNVDFFWADERCVPPGSPDSNYLLAKENLFDVVPVNPEKIHRLKGELPPAQAVAEANATIGKLLPKNPNGMPVLDLIFLGLGENAHIASLMPEIPAAVANSQAAYVVIENSPKPPPTRLSLTYAAIAAAKNVWMLASGKGKEEALRESLKADSTTPFGRVLQSRANTVIYTDIKL